MFANANSRPEVDRIPAEYSAIYPARFKAMNRTGCNAILESGTSVNDVTRRRVRDANEYGNRVPRFELFFHTRLVPWTKSFGESHDTDVNAPWWHFLIWRSSSSDDARARKHIGSRVTSLRLYRCRIKKAADNAPRFDAKSYHAGNRAACYC